MEDFESSSPGEAALIIAPTVINKPARYGNKPRNISDLHDVSVLRLKDAAFLDAAFLGSR